jgi:hypothetical protein
MGLQIIGQDWVPDACSLSPDGRQARVADFGELFSEAVLKVERPEPTRLRMHLRPGPRSAARAAELAAAETACCSFFTFTLTAAAGSLVLDVAVPPAELAILEGLADHAAASDSSDGEAG